MKSWRRKNMRRQGEEIELEKKVQIGERQKARKKRLERRKKLAGIEGRQETRVDFLMSRRG